MNRCNNFITNYVLILDKKNISYYHVWIPRYFFVFNYFNVKINHTLFIRNNYRIIRVNWLSQQSRIIFDYRISNLISWQDFIIFSEDLILTCYRTSKHYNSMWCCYLICTCKKWVFSNLILLMIFHLVYFKKYFLIIQLNILSDFWLTNLIDCIR